MEDEDDVQQPVRKIAPSWHAFKVPARLVSAPPGYPDLRMIQSIETDGDVPMEAISGHLKYLYEAGTLTRLAHPLLARVAVLPLAGGPSIFGDHVANAMQVRFQEVAEDGGVAEFEPYWSDEIH